MKTVAIIQARMGSTRMPGKVMKNLCGQSILSHIIERVRVCDNINQIIVATTDLPNDNVIVDEAIRYGANYYRGSETDVLSRYQMASRETDAEIVIRITSDCPMIDPYLLSEMIQRYLSLKNVDYLSNTLVRTYPRGLDAEIFSRDALEQAALYSHRPYEREHVTPFIYENSEKFNLFSYEGNQNFSHLRWTLDVDEDWRFVDAVYKALWRKDSLFTTNEIYDLLKKNPDLSQINSHIEQKKIATS